VVPGVRPVVSTATATPGVGRHDLVSSLVLGIACGASYLLLAEAVGPALAETPASAEIGAMWAVVSTIFVYRASLADGLEDARTRLAATGMSLVLCLVYLAVLPVTAAGVGVVIALGSLLALGLGRPQDAALTGITSTVVLVVADLGSPSSAWEQPLLRLLDTSIGLAVGLLAAGLVAGVTTRSTPPPPPAPEGQPAMTDELALGPIGNVFYFVDRLDDAVAWYAARLRRRPVARRGPLAVFDVSGVRLTLHESDLYNEGGPAGVAAYWTVDDVDAVVAEWTSHGARAHRGPTTVFTGERLCQLLDPFGNLFSVRQAPPAGFRGDVR